MDNRAIRRRRHPPARGALVSPVPVAAVVTTATCVFVRFNDDLRAGGGGASVILGETDFSVGQPPDPSRPRNAIK